MVNNTNSKSEVQPSAESKEHPENFAGETDELKPDTYSSRRSSKSKREIMEQLHRDRFPWEE